MSPGVPTEPPSSTVPDHERSLSVIVPAYDEAENMEALFAALARTFGGLSVPAEVVLVDDGSRDDTLEAARRAADGAGLDRVRFLRHRHNRGKTEAMLTGARAAEGSYLVLLDADLQYDPDAIPRFVEELDRGFDMVTGRKQGRYQKQIVSTVYNWLARKIFGVPVHDMNSMKAFRREVLDEVRLRHDWHRFFVVLAHARGFTVTEVDVEIHPRRHGRPKYSGRGRIVVGTLDLISVWFQLLFSRKPMLLFGVSGLSLFALGALTGLVALYLRFVLHQGYRPLLNLVMLLIVVGLLLFAVGFIAELIVGLRTEVEALRRDRRSDAGSDRG